MGRVSGRGSSVLPPAPSRQARPGAHRMGQRLPDPDGTGCPAGFAHRGSHLDPPPHVGAQPLEAKPGLPAWKPSRTPVGGTRHSPLTEDRALFAAGRNAGATAPATHPHSIRPLGRGHPCNPGSADLLEVRGAPAWAPDERLTLPGRGPPPAPPTREDRAGVHSPGPQHGCHGTGPGAGKDRPKVTPSHSGGATGRPLGPRLQSHPALLAPEGLGEGRAR